MSNEGTVVRVNPATLIVAANVRSNTKVTKEFVASVKQHGVLVPITGQEAEDGLRVVDGQRRTLAAIEAGLSEVPVFVVAPLEEAARIVDQVVVNEHRAELDDVEQVLAMKELEQLGVSAAAIARRTGAKRKAVDGALAVASSDAAIAALRDEQLSFDAAIAVAEFEGDPEAQGRIVRMGASSYAIAQERERRVVKERRAQLEADGVTVIDRPDYDDERTREAARLYLDEGMTQRLGDLEHEELVKIAGDGLRAFVEMAWSSQMDGREARVVYAVSGWKDRGLFGRDLATSSAPKPVTSEEIAAAKEERRRARESTKAWSTATTVRVLWLQEILQRRTMPKGWELLAARQALGELYGYPWSTVLGLLGLTRSDNGLGKYDVVKYLDEHPAKAPQVALALALGSIEGARDFDRKGWQSSTVKPYLELLASWGYELSDVERQVVAATGAVAA